jgi:hypothetical protein
MIGISQGKIRLENKILDLTTFQVRPKTSEQDLNRYYESFIEHAEEVGDYFEDRTAFDRALRDASKEKRPKFVSRDPKYPFIWAFRAPFMPFDFLRPSKRRFHDKYFIAAHCITKVSKKNKKSIQEEEKPLDERLKEDIAEKFKQYPEYEGIIEVPNDKIPSETKSTTFHESLHYLVIRYQAEIGRNFVNAFIREDLSQIEKYQAEYAIHERTVEILTDKLLSHDPDAQFENRWTHYSLNDGFRALAMVGSAIATIGVLLGCSISKPYLFPLALLPGRIRDFALEKYKKAKREEILKSIEYPKFKI